MLKKVLLAVGVLVVGLGALIASRPSEFTIERSATFPGASPEAAFAQVNDFHNWAAWSPWEKKEPEIKKTYGGPETGGVGATYGWVGAKTGEGKMEILEVKPNESIRIKLDFIKPFPASNNITFTFAKEGEGAKVSWKMEGTNSFMMKGFSLIMDMDKAVGGDFEEGLAGMKTVAEAQQTKMKADAEAAAKAEAEKKAAEEAAAANANTDGGTTIAAPTAP